MASRSLDEFRARGEGIFQHNFVVSADVIGHPRFAAANQDLSDHKAIDDFAFRAAQQEGYVI